MITHYKPTLTRPEMTQISQIDTFGIDHIGIVGAGCAGLCLATHLSASRQKYVTVFDDDAPRPDHVWSFWSGDETCLETARAQSLGSWQNWAIHTHNANAFMRGEHYQYHAVSSSVYEEALRASLERASNTAFYKARVTHLSGESQHINIHTDDQKKHPCTQVFDSATYTAPDDTMLQHFAGFYVRTSAPAFDPQTATLMDFRVSQDKGIHFMYVLPLAPDYALVESTVFSHTPCAVGWYEQQMRSYLHNVLDVEHFNIEKTEWGVIPLAFLSGPEDPKAVGIGLSGQALRASSGYAFAQIHQQVAGISLQEKNPKPSAGASRFERWMDKIFLRVLARMPEKAPDMFLRLAQTLSGDEFAQFMNGHCPWRVRLKVISAMPKAPFLQALV